MKGRDYIALIQSVDPLRRLVKDVQASGGLKCPNCDDEGFTVEAEPCIGYDGEEDLECVQVQCEFCYTVPDSIFNRRLAESG